MDFESLFPKLIYLNLGKRQDRRVEFEAHAEERGLYVVRFPGINSAFVRNSKEFETAGRYAHSLATRLALREAMRTGAQTFFMFEDDAILREDFREVLAEIDLPDDWGMFYMGGQHKLRPEVVSKNLVRVAYALDTHAWGCKAAYFRQIYEHLSSDFRDENGFMAATDMTLADLHRTIPTYATYPNLAWQENMHSDLAGGAYSNYDETGTQLWFRDLLEGLAGSAIAGRLSVPAKGADTKQERGGGRVALLFLTRDEHSHPETWEEYFESAGDAVSVYGHTKDRDGLAAGSWLKECQIETRVETEWGKVSLVRAQLELLRAALVDPENSWFVFVSESCVPIRPFVDLKSLLEIDGRS